MAFCPNCGKEVAAQTRFCPNCGATQNQVPVAGPAPVMTTNPAGTQTGLQPNVAGLLCYLLGWISGLIFYLVEKDRFIRFHAMQSIITFGATFIIHQILYRVIWALSFRLWALASLINTLFWIAEFGLAVFLMVKAYNGERYKLPTIGDLAEKYSQ